MSELGSGMGLVQRCWIMVSPSTMCILFQSNLRLSLCKWVMVSVRVRVRILLRLRVKMMRRIRFLICGRVVVNISVSGRLNAGFRLMVTA